MTQKEGIIVKTIKYKEKSKIIYAFTKESFASFLVRSANNYQSHNFSYSQEMTKVAFNISESRNKNSFSIMTSGVILNNYTKIKTDYQKLKHTLVILDYAYNLNGFVEKYDIFYNFLNEILDKISDSQYPNYYELIFCLKMLYLMGIGPIFNQCINCESKVNLVGFDFTNGGMKCINCTTNVEYYYNDMVVKTVRILYLIKLSEINDEKLSKFDNIYDDVKQFIKLYYKQYLDFSSNVDKILKQI